MQFGQLKRREFITLVGGAAVWPLGARAQEGDRVRRVGVFIDLAEDDQEGQRRVIAFREGMKALGWVKGRNI
jgi:putative ABC transport system substrate-binding protein